MTAADDAFWIRAAGQVWGPYPRARMALFAQEGRLSRRTPVGTAPGGPFVPAEALPGLQALVGAPAAGDPPAAPGKPQRALLVLIPGLAGGEEPVLGPGGAPGALSLGGGGFVLVGAETAPECRNRLTREGHGKTGLFVFEVAGEGAWFNPGKTLDRRLREALARRSD